MFRTGYLQQILSWCEKPGDHYSRAWGLWLVLTMLSYEASEEKLKAQADTLDPEAVLVMEEVSLEEVQVERRNRLLDEQEAAAGKSSAEIQEMRSKQPECKTRIHWLRSSRELIRACALSAGKCISYQWKDSQQLGCVASAWCLVELPEFIQTAVESIDSKVVSKCLTLPEKSLQLAALLLVSVVSSLRLQLNAAGFELGVQDLDFVCEIHTLQEFAVVSSSIFNSLSRLVARETAAAPSGRLQEPEEQNLMLQEPEVQEQEELQAVQQALQRAYLEEEAILELQEFLRRFHHMQQILIESLSSSGEGPYDMIARIELDFYVIVDRVNQLTRKLEYLEEIEVAPRTDDGTVRNAWGVDQTGRRVNRPNENEFRCLVSFMIGLDAQLHAAREKPSFSAGQCICPPLASTPSLDLESSLAAPGKARPTRTEPADGKLVESLVPVREPLPPVDPKARKAVEQVVEAEPLGAPPVAECGTPPAALLDKIAEEVMKEETVFGESPWLCHLLFALAVMVPSHPKARVERPNPTMPRPGGLAPTRALAESPLEEAAQSSRVRGAAFAQLIKALYDPADGDRAKPRVAEIAAPGPSPPRVENPEIENLSGNTVHGVLLGGEDLVTVPLDTLQRLQMSRVECSESFVRNLSYEVAKSEAERWHKAANTVVEGLYKLQDDLDFLQKAHSLDPSQTLEEMVLPADRGVHAGKATTELQILIQALQTIMASWFAADFGARFVISEEGGKDFIQSGSLETGRPTGRAARWWETGRDQCGDTGGRVVQHRVRAVCGAELVVRKFHLMKGDRTIWVEV
ncbi:unnamed protein product [Durusdinium trenchii]|uniref:Uncharacterized protein n=1 Tax=Durusdinium trenchii TaxID=1381693 RepID=A0ABP0N6Z7_9DINO